MISASHILPPLPLRARIRLRFTRAVDHAAIRLIDHGHPTGPVTREQVQANPRYYLAGPGLDAAAASTCGHGYTLTSSCPACDAS